MKKYYSVREQEFVESFIYGVICLAFGILLDFLPLNLFSAMFIVVQVLYMIVRLLNSRRKKQKDDEASIKSKDKAGHTVLMLFLLFICVVVLYFIVFERKLYISIDFKISYLFIILGIMYILYYLFFVYFDRLGE